MHDTRSTLRRSTVILALTLALTMSLLAGPAVADGHGGDNDGPPPHPHMLLIHYEFGEVDGEMSLTGFRRCVDLAANREVPLNAHHDGIHTGAAGGALFSNAGHWTVPGAPLTPFADCAAVEAALPIPLPG